MRDVLLLIGLVLLVCTCALARGEETRVERHGHGHRHLKEQNLETDVPTQRQLQMSWVTKILPETYSLGAILPIRLTEEDQADNAGFNDSQTTSGGFLTDADRCVLRRPVTPDVVPESFDAREAWPGCVTPVINQGLCGSCWAVASAQAMTDRLCVAATKANQKVKRFLSPQHLLSCDVGCSLTSGCTKGCNGGSLDSPWIFAAQTGLVPYSCLPYKAHSTAENGQCSALAETNPASCSPFFSTYAVNGSLQLYKSSGCYRLTNALGVQRDLMNFGPVVAGMIARSDFYAYRFGVYIADPGAAIFGGHAVRLIGWGVTSDGVKYWTIANSWHTRWGEGGYARIRRGTNEAEIESSFFAGEMILPDSSRHENEPYEASLANAALPLLPWFPLPLVLVVVFIISC